MRELIYLKDMKIGDVFFTGYNQPCDSRVLLGKNAGGEYVTATLNDLQTTAMYVNECYEVIFNLYDLADEIQEHMYTKRDT